MMLGRKLLIGGVLAGSLAGAALGLYAHAQPDANLLTTALNQAVGRTVAQAVGGKWYEYDQAFFREDLTAGHPVLVAVHAEWCTTCAAQAPSMAVLLQEPEFKDAIGYVVDFDHERKFLTTYKVRQQSTIIVFKDGVEVARSVAETDRKALRQLFERAL